MGLRKEEQPGWCRKGMGGWAFSPHQAEDPSRMVLIISLQPAPASLVPSPPCLFSFALTLSHRDVGAGGLFCVCFHWRQQQMNCWLL